MIVGMDLTYLTYIKCIVRHFYLGGGLRVGLGTLRRGPKCGEVEINDFNQVPKSGEENHELNFVIFPPIVNHQYIFL